MHVFWGMKKLVQLKFVQLLLLNRVKAKWSKNRAAQGFYYINSFSSNIFGPYSKTCTCKVHAAWGHVSRGLTVVNVKSMVKILSIFVALSENMSFDYSIYSWNFNQFSNNITLKSISIFSIRSIYIQSWIDNDCSVQTCTEKDLVWKILRIYRGISGLLWKKIYGFIF